MKRSYLTYLMVAVLPSAAAVTAGVVVAGGAWAEMRTSSWEWVGTTALNAFQADLVGLVDSLAAVAQPTPVSPEDPAWARVSRGDTVSALRPVGGDVEVMVLMGPWPDDPPETLRYAGAPIPTSPLAVARAVGARLSLYMNGRRVRGTDVGFGPDTVARPTLVALSGAPGGLPVGGGATLVALDHPTGLPPSVVAMVGPAVPPDPPLPRPLLLVTALLLLFACLAGWIQLGAGGEATGGARRFSFLLVSLVPLLTALGFLVQASRLFEDATRSNTTRNLTRALVVSRVRGVVDAPDQIHALTGFHATRVRDGRVEETTLAEPLNALANLPSPPPSFTSSGTVATADGPSFYVALRLAGRSFVVTSARRPDDRIQAFRRTLLMVAAALTACLTVLGWIVGVGAPSAPGTREPGEAPG